MKIKFRYSVLVVFWIAVTPILSLSVSAEQKTFNQESLQTIKNNYLQQSFLLVMWSIECPPCMDELKLLGKLKENNDSFKLVLVSTDGLEHNHEIELILKENRLEDVSSWTFSQANSTQLKYIVDPKWYGEMPRSYFYDAAHDRVAFSGKLTQKMVLTWLTQEE